MKVVLGWLNSNIFFANPFLSLVDENSITNTGFINQFLENLFSIRAQEFENNIVLIYVWYGHNVLMCTNFLLGLCWTKCSAEYSITNEIFAQVL